MIPVDTGRDYPIDQDAKQYCLFISYTLQALADSFYCLWVFGLFNTINLDFSTKQVVLLRLIFVV